MPASTWEISSIPEALRHYQRAIVRLAELLGVEPKRLVADLHPGYFSRGIGQRMGLPLELVQHHHAHMAACMVDNGLNEAMVGIICDGTGYGSEGGIWGCEVLVGDRSHFERHAHLRPFALVGGDQAARQTWRSAVGLLVEAEPEAWQSWWPKRWQQLEETGLALVANRAAKAANKNCSSLGRLFDGVAFLLGACEDNRYEAEAPMLLEGLARAHGEQIELPLAAQALDYGPWLRELWRLQQAGVGLADLAMAFHRALARALAQAAAQAAKAQGITKVALSGGSMVNQVLVGQLVKELQGRGLSPYTHVEIPPGDAGLAVGQLAVALARHG